MIKTFTKFSLIGLFVFCATTVFAQIPNTSPFPVSFLTIDDDGSENFFEYESMGNFGEDLFATVSGEVIWGRDDGMHDENQDGIPDPGYADSLGCSWGTVTPDVSGKIALIRRGICFFSQKIYNAQVAGAIGVIVCNDNVDSPDEVIPMGGMDSMDAVIIPAVMISVNNCQLLTTQIDAGETVNAEFRVSSFNTNLGPFAYGTPVAHIRPLDSIQVSVLNADPFTEILGVEVTVDITDPMGTVTTLTETSDIPAFTNFAVNFDAYLPELVGTYTMEFRNSINSDDVLTNTFIITEDTWQMDNGDEANYRVATISSQTFIDEDLVFDFGNTFLTGPNGGVVTHATFALGNAAELFTDDDDSDLFQVILYDLDPDEDGNGPTTNLTSYESFQPVAFKDYILTGQEGVHEEILVEFSSPALLKPNGQYALMIKYSGALAGIGVPPSYTVGGTGEYPYLGSFVFVDQLYINGFVGGPRGLIRLHTDNFAVDVKEILEAEKLSVFPNPTKDRINLQLDLASPAAEVRIGILDVMGKVVQTRILNNVQNETIKFDVTDLSNGIYFMSVSTPEGYRSVKFTIAK